MSAVIETHGQVVEDDFHWTTMGEIADVIGGGTPRTSDPQNFEGGDIPWITPADLSGYTEKFIAGGNRHITRKGLESSSARMLPAGAVLFTSRAPIGYVAIAKNPIATNQGFKSFVLKEGVLPEYVYWWLKGSKQAAESLASGTTFLEISGANAKKLPIPMVSLARQRYIVAEIEKQFSRLDEAVANLQRVKANLKRYKASVLNEFFDSKASGWWNCKLKDVCQVLSGFAFKSTDFFTEGVPVVKISNIGYGVFHWKDQEYLPLSFLESQRAFAIQPCDLLMALTRPITNGTLKVCLYPHDGSVALLNQRVAVLRVGVDLKREFLLLMMQSAAFKNQLKDALSETLQPNLSPVDLKNFEISIPPGPEQALIIAEVDRQLSIIREVEAVVDANLQRARALRQATLAKSFGASTTSIY